MRSEKIFPATKAAYDTAAAWLEETLNEINCPMKLVMQISMCFEEVFVNIASYAYDDDNGTVRCLVNSDGKSITLQLCDRGKPFDPTAKEDPDVTLQMEDRTIGGLGIFLTKQMMDVVSYERKNGENILSIQKNIT